MNNLNDKVWYTKPNLVIEPLYDRWYAWSHLISPATAAMNIVGRHLKIMNSYIQSPQIHDAAVKNPKMLGGPFMDFKKNRVNDIILLKNQTEEQQAKNIEFAMAVTELDKMLKKEAKGYSLEQLYPKVPDLLKGLVELTYDLNNNPSFRFFEPLLYKSEFYRKDSQSIALWITNNDERPFCLSTPRIDDPEVIHLPISFDHQGIDLLSKMKRNGGSIHEVCEMLNVPDNEKELFFNFFTDQPLPTYKSYEGKNTRMRYFGHACILIETQGLSILLDPLISYYGYPSNVDHFSDLDLPDVIDYVLITHNHQDHILFETLLPLRHKIRNIVMPRTTTGALQDPNLKLLFTEIGFDNVIELDDMESIAFPDCKIISLPFTGEHSDLNIQAKACFYVEVGKNKFLFAADSRILEPQLYINIQKIIGDVDVIFLGMECDGAPLTWLYGPLLTEDLPRDKDQSRRLAGSNFEKGITLVDIFNPKEVYVYAMGQEPWLEFISTVKYTPESNPIIQSDLLVEECKKRNMIAERLYGEKEILYNN
ncbi:MULTISPECIES: MBL fold metallo-hydrolase [Sphingobacterium]|uniref:MBL fold metallo-hydrolase n=1 Tax=Sphingobacterium TaxID=28453 RepID=UPI000B490560|nr:MULTISPECIES: MBL fold metallo-hydrolase [Sphingobacterium]HBX62899.1 MBL fold metallo-hydrolase [Flavobacteriaceae bacterium]